MDGDVIRYVQKITPVLISWVMLPLLAHATAQLSAIERAFVDCKVSYPEPTQAEERLACFDRIEVPPEVIGAKTEVSTAEYDDLRMRARFIAKTVVLQASIGVPSRVVMQLMKKFSAWQSKACISRHNDEN